MAGIPSAQEPIADRNGKVTTRWRAWLAGIFGTANTWTAQQDFSAAGIVLPTGTFTPTIAFGGASVGVTYGTRTGTWTQIGNRVFVEIVCNLTSRGSSTGAPTIDTLPFTPAANVTCSWWAHNYTIGAGLIPIFETSGTGIRLRSFNPSTGNEAAVAETQVDNNFELKLSLSYTV